MWPIIHYSSTIQAIKNIDISLVPALSTAGKLVAILLELIRDQAHFALGESDAT